MKNNIGKKNSRKRITKTAAALAVALAVAGSGCAGHKKAAEDGGAADAADSIVVSAEKIALETRPALVEVSGTVASGTRSVLSAKAQGHVKSVRADAGDRVRRGALLVELDSRDIEAAVEQARHGLAAAEQGALEAAEGAQAARAGVEAASASKELANATFARYERLYEQGSVSRHDLERMEAGKKVADAEQARAQNGLKSAEAGMSRAASMVEQARQALRQAEVMRGYTAVTAPFDGIVTERAAEAGQLAGPGAPLMTIEDDTDYRLEASVDESLLKWARIGNIVEVELDALPGEPLSGRVVEISPTIDPGSRKFMVKIKLPETEFIRSGMYGRAKFGTGDVETLTAPAAALVRRGQMEGFFTAGAKGVAEFRVARIGRRFGDGRVEVLSGLSEGDMAITSATDRLRDGMKVEIEQR